MGEIPSPVEDNTHYGDYIMQPLRMGTNMALMPRAFVWTASLVLGLLAGLVMRHTDLGQAAIQLVVQIAQQAFAVVGIALAGLLPLGIWLTRIVVVGLRSPSGFASSQHDLAYIGRTSVVLGLLGTVTSLAGAGGSLAGEVANGSVAAVLAVIPLVGQALLSTILGLTLSLVADTLQHWHERKQPQEGE